MTWHFFQLVYWRPTDGRFWWWQCLFCVKTHYSTDRKHPRKCKNIKTTDSIVPFFHSKTSFSNTLGSHMCSKTTDSTHNTSEISELPWLPWSDDPTPSTSQVDRILLAFCCRRLPRLCGRCADKRNVRQESWRRMVLRVFWLEKWEMLDWICAWSAQKADLLKGTLGFRKAFPVWQEYLKHSRACSIFKLEISSNAAQTFLIFGCSCDCIRKELVIVF